jgi:hypothetical protein
VRAPALSAPFFKEFVVDFAETGRTVAEINSALRERGIFGGLDLSEQYPDPRESALFCVTEMHSQADIDRLVDELARCSDDAPALPSGELERADHPRDDEPWRAWAARSRGRGEA